MAKVSPIPPGCHTLTPHLVVNGAAKAIDFYKQAFGAEEMHRMPTPDGKSLMHACLKIGDSNLFLVDEMPQRGGCAGPESPSKLGGTSVMIHMYVENADATFDRAVKAGATVRMPLMDMFWGARYGQVVDPFGHAWSIATHKEDVSPEQMQERAKEACAQMAKQMAAKA